uniref:Uncharacterized protein n=1 Tax=Caldicellulosiruptor owensensis TaxID=55205 RepID=A0A7C5Z7Q2_9FIRM
MAEIVVYNLNELFNNYGNTVNFNVSSLLAKNIYKVGVIYQSNNYVLFTISDCFDTYNIQSIIIVALENNNIKATFTHIINNEISEIIYFDEEKLSLLGYSVKAISSNLVELKIFQIDLIKNEEKIVYRYTLDYCEENENLINHIPIHVCAINNRYIMVITPNIDYFKNKIALVFDIIGKQQIFIDPHIIDEHYIYELLDMSFVSINGKKNILIKTGQICSFDKRIFFYAKKQYFVNLTETIIIIPCEELIQNLVNGKFKFNKYIVDKAEYCETLDFPIKARIYNPYYSNGKSYSIIYYKENFITKKTDIISYNLETKKSSYIGSLPFPLEKIPPIYKEKSKHFIMYIPFYPLATGVIPSKYFIKHYIESNQLSFIELPLPISSNEILNDVKFFNNDTIVETKNFESEQNLMYSVNNDMLIAKIGYGENYLFVVNPKTNDLNAIMIYPRFLKKVKKLLNKRYNHCK